MTARAPLLLAALWWGGITGISWVAVPMLFAHLGQPALAGGVAARLFSLQAQAGLVIGLGLLLLLRQDREPALREAADPEQLARWRGSLSTMGVVLAAMLCALVQEYGIAHKIVTARATGGDLRLWHAVGSALVLGQWACALAVLWRLSGRQLRDGG